MLNLLLKFTYVCGVFITKLKVRQHCWWPGINSNIENFVFNINISKRFCINFIEEPLI